MPVEFSPMFAPPKDRTVHVMVRTSSTGEATATFSSPTAVPWTLSCPSPSWLGSTTKETPDQSLTTCRTAGAYTFGWFLREHYLYGLRVEEDAASPKRLSVGQSYREDGNSSAQRTASKLASQNCSWTRGLWRELALDEFGWRPTTQWEWELVSGTGDISKDGFPVCRCTMVPCLAGKSFPRNRGALEVSWRKCFPLYFPIDENSQVFFLGIL